MLRIFDWLDDVCSIAYADINSAVTGFGESRRDKKIERDYKSSVNNIEKEAKKAEEESNVDEPNEEISAESAEVASENNKTDELVNSIISKLRDDLNGDEKEIQKVLQDVNSALHSDKKLVTPETLEVAISKGNAKSEKITTPAIPVVPQHVPVITEII